MNVARTSEQNIERPHKGAAAISVFLCSDSSCWCWAEDRAKREQASRPSNQCVYCGRENGQHNDVCVLAENERLKHIEAAAREFITIRDIDHTCGYVSMRPEYALSKLREALARSQLEPTPERCTCDKADCIKCYPPGLSEKAPEECRCPEVCKVCGGRARACALLGHRSEADRSIKWHTCSAAEPARELSASESASFAKTLARSPRRIDPPGSYRDATGELVLPAEKANGG